MMKQLSTFGRLGNGIEESISKSKQQIERAQDHCNLRWSLVSGHPRNPKSIHENGI